MADLTTNLERLATARNDITTAIIAKGGTVNTGDGFEDFPSDIATITNTYTSSDNGKVVKNGVLSSQTNYGTVTSNGTYTTTYNNKIKVSVPDSVKIGSINLLDNTYTISNQIITSTSNSLYIYFNISHEDFYNNSRNAQVVVDNISILEVTNVFLPNSYSDIKTGSTYYFYSTKANTHSYWTQMFEYSGCAYYNNEIYQYGTNQSTGYRLVLFSPDGYQGLNFMIYTNKLVLKHNKYLQSYDTYSMSNKNGTSLDYVAPTAVCVRITW